jgi:hypothetical protein
MGAGTRGATGGDIIDNIIDTFITRTIAPSPPLLLPPLEAPSCGKK